MGHQFKKQLWRSIRKKDQIIIAIVVVLEIAGLNTQVIRVPYISTEPWQHGHRLHKSPGTFLPPDWMGLVKGQKAVNLHGPFIILFIYKCPNRGDRVMPDFDICCSTCIFPVGTNMKAYHSGHLRMMYFKSGQNCGTRKLNTERTLAS